MPAISDKLMHHPLLLTRLAGLLFVALLAGSCTASRSVILSGKVTPKGQFKGGFNASGNIATQTTASLASITRAAVDAASNRDSVFFGEQVNTFAKGVLAYSLDPATPNFDVYLRYGLLERVDVGYKYTFGSHVFDAMYQFMGSTGTVDNPGAPGMYGSIGLQYSGQKSDLEDKLFLDKLQALLKFNATRRDIMIPLIFSHSLGEEESIGHIAYGVAYNHTFLSYGFEPSKIFVEQVGSRTKQPVKGFSAKNNFGSYGAFINGKIGYRFVYLLPALSVFYQKYGTYQLLNNETAELSGFTIIPSLGLQITFGQGSQQGRGRPGRR